MESKKQITASLDFVQKKCEVELIFLNPIWWEVCGGPVAANRISNLAWATLVWLA